MIPNPPVLYPNAIDAAAAQFKAFGIFGWPRLGGGYQSVSDWQEYERNRYKAATAQIQPVQEETGI